MKIRMHKTIFMLPYRLNVPTIQYIRMQLNVNPEISPIKKASAGSLFLIAKNKGIKAIQEKMDIPNGGNERERITEQQIDNTILLQIALLLFIL